MDDQHGQRTITAGMEGSDSSGKVQHGRHGNNSLRTLGSGRQGVMSPDLFGFRTAGSAWSGSSPAVCVSAIHGRQRNSRQRSSSRQAWRDPLWLRSLARQARHRLRGSVGLAWQATHGTASPFDARQAWIGYAPHGQGAAGNAAKRRDTYARQAWLPKARPDQFWTPTAGMSALGGDRSPMARQVRQRVVRRSRSGLASQVKAGMALLAQARQARSVVPARNHDASHGRHGAAWIGFSTHGRHS
jgi:hypothetical protein